MGAFFNFCKFVAVLSGFAYISYFIENRKKKGFKGVVKAPDVIPHVNSVSEVDSRVSLPEF